LEKHYLAHLGTHFALIAGVGALVGGPAGATAALCWRWAGVALLYHVTWFVNSAAHLWGSQPYRTGDQSRNNWWVGFLAFGEGWHNNHHAFEYSARHGLGRRQFDVTWLLIAALRKLGLATHVKLPTEAAKAKLAVLSGQSGEGGQGRGAWRGRSLIYLRMC
jgi:stearoyl-CoA desaturase (delta-9 desaturase)